MVIGMNENVLKKLVKIQQDLKAPKGQYNSFGKYKYRSCEDILEAVKPLANDMQCVVLVTDDVQLIGDRYYIKATAILTDAETGESLSNTAYARESQEKKGMDESQITGTASSYARKYALNGLFAIDDTKDADTDENKQQQEAGQKEQKSQQGQKKPLSDSQIKRLFAIAKNSTKVPIEKKDNLEAYLHALVIQKLKKDNLHDMTKEEYDKICNWLENKNS